MTDETPPPAPEENPELVALEREQESARGEYMPWTRKRSSFDFGPSQKLVKEALARRGKTKIGTGVFISSAALIDCGNLEIGTRSSIAGGSIIRGRISIGANSTVGSYCHIVGPVEIGSDVRIAAQVSIYAFNHGFDDLEQPIRMQPHTSKGIKIGDNVWIGALAAILDDVTIGAHSIVAAGAVVTKSFPEYSIIGGNPARLIRDRRVEKVAKPD